MFLPIGTLKRVFLASMVPVICALSLSCDGAVSPGSVDLYFQTSELEYKLDRGDGLSETINTVIRNVLPDTVRVFLGCWAWENLQVFRDSNWVYAFPSIWHLDGEEWSLTILPFQSIQASFVFWSDYPISSGLHRLAARYTQGTNPELREAYSNGFILTR